MFATFASASLPVNTDRTPAPVGRLPRLAAPVACTTAANGTPATTATATPAAASHAAAHQSREVGGELVAPRLVPARTQGGVR